MKLSGGILLSLASVAHGSSAGTSAIVKTIFEQKDVLVAKHENYQRKRVLAAEHYQPTLLKPSLDVTESNLRPEGRRLDQESCDVAFVHCLPDIGCLDCFAQLELQRIDWSGVTPDTSCEDVVKTLTDKGHCAKLQNNAKSTETFCSTFSSCVVFEGFETNNDDVVPNEGDEDYVNCTALTTCDWPGMHKNWIGDGVCHDNIHGCYNTEICKWDGGDCCEDTCEKYKSKRKDKDGLAECGHDGYACRNPNSEKCDSSITKFCPDEDDRKHEVSCADDEVKYALIMYDSFGDGWDNTKVKITSKDNKKTIFEGGLKEGSVGKEYICLSKKPACYNANTGGGSWGVESTWEIKAATEGFPTIAGSGSPSDCDFPVSGSDCEKTCEGKPDTDPTSDPNYNSFKQLYACVEDKCVIQLKGCQADATCDKCFAENSPDYCFANDAFVAVINCSVCKCGEKKDSDFCKSKPSQGGILPPAKRDEDKVKQCTPQETMAGAKAVMNFSTCSEIDQMDELVTDFDQENFGMLDSFETCAHSYADEENHGGRTALSCMQILYNAMTNPTVEGKPDAPKEAISALATHLYNGGESFCECAKRSSEDCPLCPSFQKFKTLLYESMDACKALDEVDCDSWNEYWKPCKDNLELEFKKSDFSDNDQCEYTKTNCGGVGAFPAFRRLDCAKELDQEAWDFYLLFKDKCLKDEDGRAPTRPPSRTTDRPSEGKPVDSRTDRPSLAPASKPTPRPYIPPDSGPHTPYVPAPIAPSPTAPYIPSDQQNATDGGAPKKKSHFFRNFFILLLLGGGGYVVYKRRFDQFSFVQFRRRGGNGGGAYNMMYSGESEMYGNMNASTTFEPPTLPPMMGTEMT